MSRFVFIFLLFALIILHDHLLLFLFSLIRKHASRPVDCTALWVVMEPKEKNISKHLSLSYPTQTSLGFQNEQLVEAVESKAICETQESRRLLGCSVLGGVYK